MAGTRRYIGGPNNALDGQAGGEGNVQPDGSLRSRRQAMKHLIPRLPVDLQPIFAELLEWVVFRDELAASGANNANSFGRIIVPGFSGVYGPTKTLIEATQPNDTLTFGSFYYDMLISAPDQVGTKTVYFDYVDFG